MNPEDEGRSAAEKFRDEHHLGSQPLGDLVALIEQTTGIDVAVVDAGDDEHGMAMRDPDRDRVIIAVAKTPNPMRQRSSLAHELAHVLFDDWDHLSSGDWDERDRPEQRADAFARHLLIPLRELADIFAGRSALTLADLSGAAQRFLVSPAMAAIAFQQAKLVDADTKANWMLYSTPALATRFGWSAQYQALADESNRTRAPQKLLTRAVQGYQENVVSLASLARLRGITETDMADELLQAGIQAGPATVRWAEPDELPQLDLDLSDLEEEPQGSNG